MRSPRLLRLSGAVLVGAVIAASVTGIAIATGGATISAAPPIPPGTTLQGNTGADPLSTVGEDLGTTQGCTGYGEFWSLPLTSGDRVTLKGASLAPATGLYVLIFPPGTTDATLPGAKPLLTAPLVSVTMTATATGAYPVLIGGDTQCGAADGPFNFAVLVSHKGVVVLPHLKEIDQAGSFVANVRAPDGKPVVDQRLTLKLYGIYKRAAGTAAKPHLLGTATPVGGAATFNYSLPASLSGGTVRLEVTGSGLNYQPIASVSGTFRVQRAK